MKAWEKWHAIGSVYMTAQRLKESALGCPACHSDTPTHIQIRAELPTHAWRCPCGQVWAVKDGRAILFDETLPWSRH